jgi:hypothetical protein
VFGVERVRAGGRWWRGTPVMRMPLVMGMRIRVSAGTDRRTGYRLDDLGVVSLASEE